MVGWDMLIVGVAAFVLVTLKAIQQQNVTGGNYKLIIPVSYGMATCEVAILLYVAASRSWMMALPIGTGAGLGAILGMFIYRKYIKRKDV